jgi:hypothetical protein
VANDDGGVLGVVQLANWGSGGSGHRVCKSSNWCHST